MLTTFAAVVRTVRRMVLRCWGNMTGARPMRYASIKAARCDRVMARVERDCDEWIDKLPPGLERRRWLTLQCWVRMMRTRNSWSTQNRPIC